MEKLDIMNSLECMEGLNNVSVSINSVATFVMSSFSLDSLWIGKIRRLFEVALVAGIIMSTYRGERLEIPKPFVHRKVKQINIGYQGL